MKRQNTKYLSTVEYLEHVLSHWEAFSFTHTRFSKAIEDILRMYKQSEMLNHYLQQELEKEKASHKAD